MVISIICPEHHGRLAQMSQQQRTNVCRLHNLQRDEQLQIRRLSRAHPDSHQFPLCSAFICSLLKRSCPRSRLLSAYLNSEGFLPFSSSQDFRLTEAKFVQRGFSQIVPWPRSYNYGYALPCNYINSRVSTFRKHGYKSRFTKALAIQASRQLPVTLLGWIEGSSIPMHGCKSRFAPSCSGYALPLPEWVREFDFEAWLYIQPGLHPLISVFATPETIYFRVHDTSSQGFEYWLSISDSLNKLDHHEKQRFKLSKQFEELQVAEFSIAPARNWTHY